MTDTNFAGLALRDTRNAARPPQADERPSDNEPPFPVRFLEPPGFVWGSFAASDGAKLRWGYLAAAAPRAECVMVGGFTECIEKYFETTADLVARGLSV